MSGDIPLLGVADEDEFSARWPNTLRRLTESALSLVTSVGVGDTGGRSIQPSTARTDANESTTKAGKAAGRMRILGCKHFVRSIHQLGLVCACHPGAGFFCPRCHTKHSARHPQDVERQCDECLRIVPLEDGPRVYVKNSIIKREWWKDQDIKLPRVGDTGGYSRPFPLAVAFTCIGMCEDCEALQLRLDNIMT